MNTSKQNEVKVSPCHIWGDIDFDWNALHQAESYLSRRCRQFGRIGLWTKEKYGTLRVDTMCAFVSQFDFIHSLVKPGHAYYRWPKWFRKYVDWPLGHVMDKIGIVWLIRKYQQMVLKYFWKRAAKKWPHIADEILDEYDFYFGENKW